LLHCMSPLLIQQTKPSTPLTAFSLLTFEALLASRSDKCDSVCSAWR